VDLEVAELEVGRRQRRDGGGRHERVVVAVGNSSRAAPTLVTMRRYSGPPARSGMFIGAVCVWYFSPGPNAEPLPNVPRSTPSAPAPRSSYVVPAAAHGEVIRPRRRQRRGVEVTAARRGRREAGEGGAVRVVDGEVEIRVTDRRVQELGREGDAVALRPAEAPVVQGAGVAAAEAAPESGGVFRQRQRRRVPLGAVVFLLRGEAGSEGVTSPAGTVHGVVLLRPVSLAPP